MSNNNGTYEPLGDDVEETVVRKTRRKTGKRRRGGKAKAALLLGLLVLVLALVALAIALPIVLSQQASSSADSAAVRSMNMGSAFSPTAFVSPSGWQFVPTSGASPSPPVGPNLNTGSNVYCFRTSTGQVLSGGLMQTGVKSTSNLVTQVEVSSCESGNTFFVSPANLQLCQARCQMPVWQAAEQGLIQPALASQDFVCQNGQVFVNTKQSQQSFYLKYSAVQPETLVSECASDNSYWVPNVEMVACTPEQTAKCNAQNLARPTPRGVPVILPGEPGAAVIHAGPICQTKGSQVWKATGFTRNRFLWWRLKHVNEAEVTACAGGPVQWIDVTELTTCAAAAASGCK